MSSDSLLELARDPEKNLESARSPASVDSFADARAHQARP